jgi:tetratricopeptide (TPR) repeat protein
MAACAAFLLLAQARASQGSRRSSRAQEIRAEMAGVLLQSKRYDEAAREYSVLLAASPDNVSYRVGLARALAWGGRPAEAEHEITRVLERRPNDASMESLLLAARRDLSPSADRARSWFLERSTVEYRQILARALARERRFPEALAQYDTLLRQRGTPALLVERAQVNVDRHDLDAAERDAQASIAWGPSAAAYQLLGDVRRWRGEYAQSRAAYQRALALSHDALRLESSLAQLARDERPAVAFVPDVYDAPGWESSSSTAHDNLGVDLTTVTLRHGRPLSTAAVTDGARASVDVSYGVTVLRLAQANSIATPVADSAAPAGADVNYGGYGGDVALSAETERGRLYARGRVSGGVMVHPSANTSGQASLAATAFYSAWGVGADLRTGAAYPSLMTVASFLPAERTPQLRETSRTLSLFGPVGRVDIALMQQQSDFTDGNRRSTVAAYARAPLTDVAALVYSGSQLSFARASLSYWDPERYTSHAAGVELRVVRRRGFSAAARLLPGLAWSVERPHARGEQPSAHDAVFQVGGGGELGYRSDAWELLASAGYGTARAGGYQRLDATLAMRWLR